MKSSFFCLALAWSFQCFSMQSEMTPVSDKNLTEQLSSNHNELIMHQCEPTNIRISEEELLYLLSRPLSYYSRRIPDPGFKAFYDKATEESKLWIFCRNDISHDEQLEIHEKIKNELRLSIINAGLPSQRKNIKTHYSYIDKLMEDCLMFMIERAGRRAKRKENRYYYYALKGAFFRLFHSEMIGKEFQPGYLKPGDDPDVMCRGDWGTWCARESGD